jgi:hypothetical protein
MTSRQAIHPMSRLPSCRGARARSGAIFVSAALLFANTPALAQRATGAAVPWPAPVPVNAPVYQSNATRIVGIVVTSVASTTLVAGLVWVGIDYGRFIPPHADSGVVRGEYTLYIGLPLALGSLALAGVGVPLWIIGAQPPTSAPPVAVGPGGLRVTF